MLSVKVEIFIDGRVTHWSPGSETTPLIVKENQLINVKICVGRANELLLVPKLAVEDHSIKLHREEYIDEKGCGIVAFSSAPEKVFRESFGLAFLRLFIADEEFLLSFEVLATKVTAIQTERMIRYLSQKRENIIRVCLSRTMRPTGMKDGWSDPETVLSTAEKIINTILDCRGELRQQIRSKLVPAKVPAWKAEQSGSLIDPVDVIFNIDSLRPSDGCQDVVLRGRTYSTSAIDVTALVKNTNVEENIILIGGLYSIRRVITSLMDEIGAEFKGRKIAAYDKEYVSLGEMLIKLAGGAMYERCERVIFSTENLIRMFENDFEIKFAGEVHPRITPYVRSSRLYRNIFEQYDHWYGLGSPSIDGNLFLIKLRSLSKIFEFFVLFKLFDYLSESGWKFADFSMSKEFEKLIPDVMTFEKGQIKIILSYEPNVVTFSGRTSHMELVKLSEYSGSNWTPDYTMRVEDASNNLVRYLILDAKYSSPYWVESTHLRNLYDKYYDHMAVFDKLRNCISRNQIMGVFAIFPEALDRASRAVNMRFPEFGLDGRGPMMMPMLAGLPISLEADALMEKWLDKALRATMLSMGLTLFSETTLPAAA